MLQALTGDPPSIARSMNVRSALQIASTAEHFASQRREHKRAALLVTQCFYRIDSRCHRVRHHAKDSNCGKNQRQRRENPQQRHRETNRAVVSDTMSFMLWTRFTGQFHTVLFVVEANSRPGSLEPILRTESSRILFATQPALRPSSPHFCRFGNRCKHT